LRVDSASRSASIWEVEGSEEGIGLRPLVKDIALASVGGPVSADLQKVIDALSAADGVPHWPGRCP